MTKLEAIQTAAAWWTEKLGRRDPHSNGDNSYASIFACILADIGAEDKGMDAKLEVFKTELERSIAKRMDCVSKNHLNSMWLSCDYGPGEELAIAADKAGINHLAFPFKTNLFIGWDYKGDYSVKVSDGYAQPYEEIGPVKE